MESKRSTPSPQEKIAQAREFYAALNARNLDKALGRFSDEAVFDPPLTQQPIRGRAAIRAAVERIFKMTDEYIADVHDILANDDHVVSLLTVRARRGDRVLDERGVHVAHLDKEGKIAQLWATTDPAPHRAFLTGT